MAYLSSKYGLTTDEDLTSENGQLFLSTFNALLRYYGYDHSMVNETNIVMEAQLKNSYAGVRGLYHRNPDLTDRRIMSHDNLLGIMCWSKINKTNHRHEIWRYLLIHGGLYDNTRGRSPQLSKYLPYSPQTILVAGLCADSKLIYLLFPILFPIFVLNVIWGSTRPKEHSTSKIIDWLTFQALGDLWFMKRLKSFFEEKMKEQYGQDYITGLMDTFHGRNSKKFPINKLLGIGV